VPPAALANGGIKCRGHELSNLRTAGKSSTCLFLSARQIFRIVSYSRLISVLMNVKVKITRIYIAPSHEISALTQFYLQTTPGLHLTRKRSPDGATTNCGRRHLILDYLSFIDPGRMKD